MKPALISLVLVCLVGFSVGSCARAPRKTTRVVVVESHKGGPPPHAPAHGHRHKHREGVELRFDSGLGVYVVIGRPGYYYYDGFYFRASGGSWESAISLNHRWTVAHATKVPPGLCDRAGGKGGKVKGKGKDVKGKDVKGKGAKARM